MRYTRSRRVRHGSLSVPSRVELGIPGQLAANNKHIEKTTKMKKTIIALMALAGVACAEYSWDKTGSYSYTWDYSSAAVLDGTASWTFTTTEEEVNGNLVTVATGVNNGYELGTNSFLCDALTAANSDTNASLTFSTWYYWSGGDDWGEAIFHAGNADTGVTFAIGAGKIAFYTGSKSDADVIAAGVGSAISEDTWTHVSVTLSGGNWTAYINGAQTGEKQELGDIAWADSDSEKYKYSVGCKAPGYNAQRGMNDSGSKMYGTTVSYTYTPAVPEPTTATLSLLALAGLAARRRRK